MSLVSHVSVVIAEVRKRGPLISRKYWRNAVGEQKHT